MLRQAPFDKLRDQATARNLIVAPCKIKEIPACAGTDERSENRDRLRAMSRKKEEAKGNDEKVWIASFEIAGRSPQ